MDDDQKKVIKYIAGIFVAVIILIIMFFFMRNFMILQNQAFYVVVFSFACLMGSIWFVSFIISKFKKDSIGIEKDSLGDFYTRINEILETMPTSETFNWDMGKSTRIDTRVFGKKTYMGIIGNARSTNRRMLVIYCTEDDRIVKFTGDPTTANEINLFSGFHPVYQDNYGMMAEYMRTKDRRRRPKSPSFIINNNPSEILPEEEI